MIKRKKLPSQSGIPHGCVRGMKRTLSSTAHFKDMLKHPQEAGERETAWYFAWRCSYAPLGFSFSKFRLSDMA